MHNDLYSQVLIDPSLEGADRLCILSGYATSAMSFHHLADLQSKGKSIDVHLIVGMTLRDGLTRSNHEAFKKIVSEDYKGKLECSYLINPPPAHAKVYIWCKGKTPIQAYTGSANYTQTAFSGTKQYEYMVECDPANALRFFQKFISNSIYCTHPDVDERLITYSDSQRQRSKSPIGEQPEIRINSEFRQVQVSLLGRNGKIQTSAGLNWGFRQTAGYNRNKNEAYLQLPPEVYKSDFFPIRSQHFTVLTDDNKVLICTRAQKDDQGQAIETPHNNSLIGEYFRCRLGLPNSAFVTKQDLERYGRTYVTFLKIDDETFYMDFSLLDHSV